MCVHSVSIACVRTSIDEHTRESQILLICTHALARAHTHAHTHLMSVMFTGLINLRALDTDNVPKLDSWGWAGRYLCQDPSRGRWRDPSRGRWQLNRKHQLPAGGVICSAGPCFYRGSENFKQSVGPSNKVEAKSTSMGCLALLSRKH